jgi:hypothetical protein
MKRMPRAASKIESKLIIAVSLSFPIYDEGDKKSVKYRVNKVYLRNLGLLDDDEESDEDLD